MYKVIAIDKKTGEEVRHEWVEEAFLGRWVTIFLKQGFNVFIK